MTGNNWTTSDFTSACIARASGIPLLDLIKDKPHSITFVFADEPQKCEAILKTHWDRSLKLETRLLFETINELKTRIYERLKQ